MDKRSGWRARIAGYEVPLLHRGDRLSFILPGNAGELRGRIRGEGKEIAGHWVQPTGTVYNNRYASPVRLSSVSKGVWVGQVVPLEERISFYVWIRRAPDGALSAVIRNPEFNWFRRRTFTVQLETNAVILSQGEQQIRGSYDAESGTLSLPLLSSSPPLKLTRRTEQDAIGLYPRVPPPGGSYLYRAPIRGDDGWPTSSLAEAGLDGKPIAELIQKILSANFEEDPLPMHSLLIARHGKLMAVNYNGGAYGEGRKFIPWQVVLMPQYLIPAAVQTK